MLDRAQRRNVLYGAHPTLLQRIVDRDKLSRFGPPSEPKTACRDPCLDRVSSAMAGSDADDILRAAARSSMRYRNIERVLAGSIHGWTEAKVTAASSTKSQPPIPTTPRNWKRRLRPRRSKGSGSPSCISRKMQSGTGELHAVHPCRRRKNGAERNHDLRHLWWTSALDHNGDSEDDPGLAPWRAVGEVAEIDRLVELVQKPFRRGSCSVQLL